MNSCLKKKPAPRPAQKNGSAVGQSEEAQKRRIHEVEQQIREVTDRIEAAKAGRTAGTNGTTVGATVGAVAASGAISASGSDSDSAASSDADSEA